MERYDSYRNLGLDWIDQVPGNWTHVPFFRVLHEVKKKYDETDDDLDLLSLSGEKGIYVKEYDSYSQKRNKDELGGYNVVREGEVVLNPLVNPLKLDYFGLSLSKIEGVVSPVYLVFRTQELPKFIEYYFKSHLTIQNLLSNTKGIRPLSLQLSRDTLKGIKVLLPPFHEQEQIVEFLDRKTALIDSLIEKTVRKIELLKEKRTSLINEVVTKGLNPDVELKDSGVEWIGEIPNHWGIEKLKYFISMMTEKGSPSPTDIRISPENVENGTGVCHDYYSDHFGEGVIFDKGDILLNKLRLYLKKIIYCDFQGFSMGEMIVLRTLKGIDRYHFYTFFHQGLIDRLDVLSTGVKLPRVSPEDILNNPHPFPPLQEQEQIVEYLDNQTSVIDSTITTEEKRIELLKEYRQSLISEVVTGKVKVTRDE